jgi:hypothetical protein
MKIDRVYIVGCKNDLRLTQCCVASIRHWYRHLPITLIKDESHGAYDTTELERYWQVDIFRGKRKHFGWGWGKLEPFFLPPGERCLVLDSDIVFAGPVLKAIEPRDEDVLVEVYGSSPANVSRYVYDLPKLQQFDADFIFPGFNFNTGQLVVATGCLKRDDFAPFLTDSDPPQLLRSDIFKCADQGLLNYLLVKKARQGVITLGRVPFMEWAGYIRPWRVRRAHLRQDSPHRFLVHFAGPKKALFSANRNGHLLRYFEACYYSRLPNGTRRRTGDRLRRVRDVVTRRQRW